MKFGGNLILLSTLILGFSPLVQAEEIVRIAVSGQPDVDFISVSNVQNQFVFSNCENEQTACEIIGSSSGYAPEDLDKMIQWLNSEYYLQVPVDLASYAMISFSPTVLDPDWIHIGTIGYSDAAAALQEIRDGKTGLISTNFTFQKTYYNHAKLAIIQCITENEWTFMRPAG